MLKRRNAPERMAREMFGRFRIHRRESNDLVGDLLFLESREYGAHERTAGNAKNLHAHRFTPYAFHDSDRANAARSPDQPPGESIALRPASADAPIRSR